MGVFVSFPRFTPIKVIKRIRKSVHYFWGSSGVIKHKETVEKLLPIFDQVWLSEGVKRLELTTSVLNKSFKRQELTASMVLNPTIFSCSHPLILNITKLLNFNKESSEDRLKFVELVYHELLHRYLDDNYLKYLNVSNDEASPHLKKYGQRSELIEAHLHLYALQEYVYRQNNMIDEWQYILGWTKKIPHSDYQETMNIIQKVGYQKFVDELLNYN